MVWVFCLKKMIHTLMLNCWKLTEAYILFFFRASSKGCQRTFLIIIGLWTRSYLDSQEWNSRPFVQWKRSIQYISPLVGEEVRKGLFAWQLDIICCKDSQLFWKLNPALGYYRTGQYRIGQSGSSCPMYYVCSYSC